MRMPRAIPVNIGSRIRVTNLHVTSNPIQQALRAMPNHERILGARGKVIEYVWDASNFFRVEHDDGSFGIYDHSEVEFEDQRIYLPDCKECGCFSVSHIPRSKTKMKIKCLSCRKCEGYIHPTESICNALDRDTYYDPEQGRFERFED
jgi:hypothetical protein